MKLFMNSVIFMGLLLAGNNLVGMQETRMSDAAFETAFTNANTPQTLAALAKKNPGEGTRLSRIETKVKTFPGGMRAFAAAGAILSQLRTADRLPAGEKEEEEKKKNGNGGGGQPVNVQAAIQQTAQAAVKTIDAIKKTYGPIKAQLTQDAQEAIDKIVAGF